MKRIALKKHTLLLVVCIVIGIVSLHYSFQKSDFFLDEVYSHVLANSEYNPWIVKSRDGNIQGEIFTQQELMDYVSVDGTDAFNYKSVYYNQTQDVHPPMYYWLLHTVSSLFSNTFSKWIGLSLNLMLYALTCLVLYKMARLFFRSWKAALIVMAVYALSSMGISSMLYIRMYLLLALWTVLLAYLVLLHMRTSNRRLYPFIFLTVFAGMMTHFYYAIYAFFLCAFYDIYLLMRKDYKAFLGFSASALGGILLMFIVFPSWYSQLFLQTTVSAETTINNLKDTAGWHDRVDKVYDFFVEPIKPVGYLAIPVLFILLFRVKYIISYFRKKNRIAEIGVILIPVCLAFLMISIICPYVIARYIFHLLPLILMICAGLPLYIIQAAKCFPNRFYPIILLAVILVSIGSLDRHSAPEFIYAEKKESYDIVSAYKDSPCLYMTENKNPPITSDLPRLLTFDEVYVVDFNDPASLQSYLSGYEGINEVVVFSATYPKPYGTETWEWISENIPYARTEKLWTGDYSEIHLLTLS